MITKYFKPINQTEKQPKATKAKKLVVISSDEEEESTSRKTDVIPNTPGSNKKNTISKLVKGKGKKKQDLKPVNIESFLSTSPVKQSPIAKSSRQNKKVEETKKRDEAFKQTLEELDNSDMDDIDMVDLDKTIDEAMKENEATTPKKDKASTSTPSRKRKAEQSLNESGLDPDQERYEKRRYSAMLYQQYKNRGGPPQKGEKEMPEGKPDCLKNLCFIKTGILDSLDSEDLDTIVKKHGGRTVKAISRKVNYVLVGDEPGPSKVEKARSFGIPEITENQFLDMILTKSGKAAKYCTNENGVSIEASTSAESPDKSSRRVSPRKKEPSSSSTSAVTPKKLKLSDKSPVNRSKTPDKTERNSSAKRTTSRKKESSVSEDDKSSVKKMKTPTKLGNGDASSRRVSPRKLSTSVTPKKGDGNDSSAKQSPRKQLVPKSPAKTTKSSSKERQSSKLKESPFRQKSSKASTSSIKPQLSLKHEETKQFDRDIPVVSDSDKSWTEKYKPANTKAIMGQQDASSNMQKLKNWLTSWNKNHTGKNKPTLQRPSPWAKNDNGAYFKAALLSGPPGVGKTTTATLVAKELGYDVVEMNASDTRNKKLLHEEISTLLSSKSVASFFKDGKAPTQKHVLLMDEVDGMSGNQDRGGIQELIALIKNTNIPIICMCNDRQHPKIRSLVNYCFDLRFGKIKPEAVLRPLMGICHKEGIKVTPQIITQIFVSSGNDIRQTLNHLSMWSASDKVLSTEKVTTETEASKKDVIMGPWEVIRKVFSATEHESMSLSDKSKLFFYDYSIGPLFVQENYLQVKPNCPSKKILERVALTADAISKSDIFEAKIRSSNNWSLMESQAFHSSVLPGHYMEGHFTGQINFPSWLGKNSKTNKFKRLASELQTHMRLSTTSSKKSLLLDDVYYLRDKIVKPMVNNGAAGVSESLETMKYYNLTREDLDSILELSAWSDSPDPMKKVESKVKAAFTRTYNKEGIALPYSINATFNKKKSSRATDSEDIYGEEEENVSDNEEDDTISNDAMVTLKKPSAKKADKPSTSKASRGRGGKAKK